MTMHLTADAQWAQGMVDQQVRDLFGAMITAESRAKGAQEFAEHLPGEKVSLPREVREQIAHTVEALQNLYVGSESA